MIGALISLISLDVTEKLVGAGLIAATLQIAGATTTTPIVLQTTAPHGCLYPVHGVVSGVGGMPEADGTWILTPSDPTHLTLTTFTSQGAPSPSVGAGTYSSGGQVQFAFPDRRILVGRKYRTINSAPPRIVFSPLGSPAWDFIPYGGSIPPLTRLPQTRGQMTAEMQTMTLQRQVATELHRFKVWIWGAMNPPDPDFGDYDLTQAVYHQLIESVFRLCAGRWKVAGGKWTSQDPDAGQWDARGQEYEMLLEIQQPVTALPLAFVPPGTSAELAINLVGGASGDTITIEVP